MCGEKAKETADCPFFMYSYFWPALGCFCCSSADGGVSEDTWNIYQNCYNGGLAYDDCFNQEALIKVNDNRSKHGASALEIDAELAKAA